MPTDDREMFNFSIQGDFTSFIEDSKNEARKVIVIYTGGTIGMVRDKNNVLVPAPRCLEKFFRRDPQIHDSNFLQGTNSSSHFLTLPYIEGLKRVCYHIHEYDILLDSSNMAVDDWIHIAKDIKKLYEDYDGFVVLHGTDTLAYTSSALSFMLENLGKPVVLTGSQVPIMEPITDGKDNFISALAIAGNFHIPEVAVFFNHKLFRGNRITKISTNNFAAFKSHNYPPLAEVGTSFVVNYKAVFTISTIAEFSVHTNLNRNVRLLKIYPGISLDLVKAILEPPVEGVVVESFGAGNMPNSRLDIVEEFRLAVSRGVIIIIVTQCSVGTVSCSYEPGKVFTDVGVISGGDMTPEAALTKLCYVISKEQWSLQEKIEKMARNLRGESCQNIYRSCEELELINAIAQTTKISSVEEQKRLYDILFPSMLFDAVVHESINKIGQLIKLGADLNATNVDSRTALHIACCRGNTDLVEFLLLNGANIHVKDRYGNVPLLDAVRHDHMSLIKLLRSNGAYLNMHHLDLGNSLCRAAGQGQVTRLKSFVLAGANLNITNMDLRTPLHEAVLHNQLPTIRYLLHKGVKKCKLDILGKRPIDLARAIGSQELIQELMS